MVGGSAEEVEVLDYTALEGEDADCDFFGHILLRGSWCSGCCDVVLCGMVVVGSLNWPIISLLSHCSVLCAC